MSDIKAIKKKIENTKKTKIDNIDSNQIGEFAQVKIDTNAPIQTRFMKFMKDVENPYIFKSRGVRCTPRIDCKNGICR